MLPSAGLFRSLLRWAGGLLAGLALYPLLGAAAGTPIHLADFGLFSRAFASGFASSPIQVPGPVLVVLPVLVASARLAGAYSCVSAAGHWQTHRRTTA